MRNWTACGHHGVRKVAGCVAALMLALTAATCGEVDAPTAHGKWLANELVASNAQWSLRAPELVAMKYSKMARSRFQFFRGTAGLYWKDALHWQGRARLVATGGAACKPFAVVIGDPHIENIGTFRAANGEMFLGFNDFDLADIAPMQGDVMRLAVSWFAAGDAIFAGGDAAEPASQQAATAAVSGYADELVAIAQGDAPMQDRSWAMGVTKASDDILDKAREKGDEQSKLEDYAPRDASGARALRFGDIEDVAEDGIWEDTLQALAEPARRDVLAAVDQYEPAQAIASLSGRKTLDVARRLGAGVASYPADRFYVLQQAPAASGDYVLLEMKETGSGVPLYGLELGTATTPLPGGQRVAHYQVALSDRADGDAWLGHVELGALSFRVRELTGYQRGFDVADLAEDVLEAKLDRSDINELAQEAGALLARLHVRGAVWRNPALTHRGAAIGLSACVDAAFVGHTVLAAKAYWRVTLADYAVFLAVLANYPEWLRYGM